MYLLQHLSPSPLPATNEASFWSKVSEIQPPRHVFSFGEFSQATVKCSHCPGHSAGQCRLSRGACSGRLTSVQATGTAEPPGSSWARGLSHLGGGVLASLLLFWGTTLSRFLVSTPQGRSYAKKAAVPSRLFASGDAGRRGAGRGETVAVLAMRLHEKQHLFCLALLQSFCAATVPLCRASHAQGKSRSCCSTSTASPGHFRPLKEL